MQIQTIYGQARNSHFYSLYRSPFNHSHTLLSHECHWGHTWVVKVIRHVTWERSDFKWSAWFTVRHVGRENEQHFIPPLESCMASDWCQMPRARWNMLKNKLYYFTCADIDCYSHNISPRTQILQAKNGICIYRIKQQSTKQPPPVSRPTVSADWVRWMCLTGYISISIR